MSTSRVCTLVEIGGREFADARSGHEEREACEVEVHKGQECEEESEWLEEKSLLQPVLPLLQEEKGNKGSVSANEGY